MTADPVRTCVACRVSAPASGLLRVRLFEDLLIVDQPVPGRGAWIGPSSECLELAIRRRALPRALRSPVSDRAVEQLREVWPSVAASRAAQPPTGCTVRG